MLYEVEDWFVDGELRGYGGGKRGCAAVSGSLPASEQDVGGSGVYTRGIAPPEG